MKIKNILVSQPRPTTEKSPYYELASKHGVKIDFHQFIHIEELTPKEFRAQHINILDYTAIIFNSRLGIDHFFSLCEQLRVAVPESMHYYCISESVANYLQKYIQYRKRKVFFGVNNRFEDVLPAMQRRPSEKYLMVMSDVHNHDTIDMFASHNIKVTPAVMYRTVINMFAENEKKNYDMFVLFTPIGVKALKANYPQFKREKHIIACMGAATISALSEEGLGEPDIIAPSKQYPSITAALDSFLQANAEEEEKKKMAKAKTAVKKTATKSAKTTSKKTTSKTTSKSTSAEKKSTSTTKKATPKKTTTAKTTTKPATTKTTKKDTNSNRVS